MQVKEIKCNNCNKNKLEIYNNKIYKNINNIYFINNRNIIDKDNIKLEEINSKDNIINI